MNDQVKRFLSFAFASADVLIELDARQRIAFALGAASSLLGHAEQALAGRPWLDLFAPEDRALVRSLMGALETGNHGGSRVGPIQVRLDAGYGGGRRVLLSAARLVGAQSAISCALSTVPLALSAGAGAAETDPRSGLLTADGFAAAAAEAQRIAREQNQKVEMTLLELPQLSDFARSKPEASADLVQRIGSLLRAASIDGNSAGRLAEDRFGVIHGDGARLQKQLDAVVDAGRQAGVTLAVAEKSVPLDGDSLGDEDALRAIRFAVNQFAAAGPEAIVESLADTFETMVKDTVKRIGQFNSLVREDRFSLAFQPIVELSSNRLHHFEVLARFDQDKSPFEQIQFAEEIGIIEQFDHAVCRRAIQILRQRGSQTSGQTSASHSPHISLAINISGRSVANPIFVRLLLELLDQAGDLRTRLLFEITESAQMKDLAQARNIIQQIRNRGFRVCLDDFGAGAASFQYLQALDIDFVKIDGAYVRRLGETRRDDALLQGIVRLCDDLAIATIGEMIESSAQAKLLHGMGVGYGQGWLFGRPGPEPEWVDPNPPAASPSRLGRRRGASESWG